MLLIGLFAHYSWNKETGLEKGTVFFFFSWLCCFSCCSRFGSPVILLKKKKKIPTRRRERPKQVTGTLSSDSVEMARGWGFTALTRLLTIQGVLVPSYEKSVPPKA